MNNSLSLNQLLLTFGIPALIILSSVALALSSLTHTHPDLYMGITYDLILTAPLAYFFLIRKKKIPKITVLPFITFGTLIAYLILPENQRFHFDLITSILIPLVEITVISTISYYTYQAVKEFKKSTGNEYDFYLLLQHSAIKALDNHKVAKIISSEIALFYYALFNWKRRKLAINEFTYHKKNGIIALLGVFIFLSLVEMFVLHILLALWNPTVAWVLSFLSFYGGLMLFAHIKAILRRPHVLKNNRVELKNGLFGYTSIPYQNIEQVVLSSKPVKDEGLKVHKFAILGELERHNMVIYLKEDAKADIAYGMSKTINTLLLQVDEAENFRTTILEKMESLES